MSTTPEPSAKFLQILGDLPSLPPADLVYLHAVLPSFIAKAKSAPEELLLIPAGEELAAKALAILKSKENLTGPENALFAGVLIQYGSQFGLGLEDAFDSRTVTQELRRENRLISNITSVMDSLKEKGFVEHLEEGKKGAHREYRITPRGSAEAARLSRRFEEKQAGAA